MANFFDQFDDETVASAATPTVAPAVQTAVPETAAPVSGGNFFDQFDAPTEKPAAQSPGVPASPQSASPANMASYLQATAPANAAERFGHGGGDILLQAAKIPLHIAASLPDILGSNSAQTLRDQLDAFTKQRENDWQANRMLNNQSGFEGLRTLGQIGAAAPAMALAPETAAVGRFAPVINAVRQAVVPAAATGALLPTTGDGSFAAQTAKNMAVSGATAGVTHGALGWLASDASPGTQQYRDAVNYLRERNVVPTPAQNIGPNAATSEDMTSTLNWNVPGAQKTALKTFNLGGLNEALKPLGLSYTGEPGREGFGAVAGVIDKAFDNLRGKISLPVPDAMRTQIGQIVSDAATPDPGIATTVNRILDKALYSQVDSNNVLSGTAFKNAEEMLGDYAKTYTGDNASATERGVGRALQGVQGALRDALADANPQYADQLRATNRAYAILARLQKAVPTNDPDGLFTPARLAGAVRAADNTVRDRAYTQGDALLQQYSDAGLRVLGNKFPNSGTAARTLSADPLAWPFQIGTTLLTKPLYSGIGSRVAGAAVNAGSQGVPMIAGAGQQALPYMMPAIPPMLLGNRNK